MRTATLDRPDRLPDILAAVDLAELVARYAAPGRARGMYRCPFSDHEDTNPSFHVAGQVWKCHGCGRGGGIVDFVALIHGLSKAEAVDHLAAEYGIDVGGLPLPRRPLPSPQPRPAPRKEVARRYAESDLREWVERCHELLLSASQAGPARVYLRSRGLTGEEVRRYRIGYGATGAADPFWRLKHRLIFPCLGGAEGRVVPTLKGVSWRPEAKYLALPDDPKRAWGIDEINPGRGPLVIVEGVFDRIAVERDVGDAPVFGQAVALRGKALRADDAAEIAARGFDHAYVALDARADVTVDDLTKIGDQLADVDVRPIFVVGPPDGMDWGDLLAHPVEELVEAVVSGMVTA